MTQTLILGGTAWLGREIARQLLEAGDDVTCLARGESGSVAAGATLVRSDRRASDAYAAVTNRNWDDIIELSSEADLVSGALAALADTTPHWTLVSSVSVYASNSEADADEDAALVEPTDMAAYAHAKVAAERATAQAVGDRLLIARPGLIAGPGDTSDRFSYWVARLALAWHEPVLGPDTQGRAVQFIDVRDLAAWIIAAGHRGLTGTYNAVGTKRELAVVLAAAQQVAGHDGALISADDAWLIAHDVNYWAGPRSLPLWLPRSANAFFQRGRERFLESGGTERSLHETLSDVLADERIRGLNRERRAGLTREDELRLLDELRNS
ncbi:NAD-dependent epimerase/dehydratase family protein [Cryobacterium zhongshanensis]|uniref:NAD-dependent epimerase/dehydratase family protein n=1 Tax=Cryobacterium zhongshanensis TaxID=2928153 RepID=A0AA41UM49_9MICO|nr:NAD-dependent epimerase/dehydratase family protein [Cryobacterium zhongshanensis]MCI4659481.1 NAD-dependent epimerase/dehydratase family protein [Cryobacterium zhongshanensis]